MGDPPLLMNIASLAFVSPKGGFAISSKFTHQGHQSLEHAKATGTLNRMARETVGFVFITWDVPPSTNRPW